MLDRITDYLVGRLSDSNYFDKIFPFVEMVSKEDATYPAEYIGKGEYQSVNNFDNYNGMCYLRMTGKQRFNKANEKDLMDVSMCEGKLEITFPLRLVACVPKSKVKDDAFADERISKSLISYLVINGGPLKDDLQATSVNVFPESVTFSNQEILNEEYSGIEKMQYINYNFSYHAIDFNVVVEVKESCLTQECSEAYYG